MKQALSLVAAVCLLAFSGVAAADETPAPVKGEQTVATVIVHGKRMRPNASITVARVPLESTLAGLKKPLVDRIAKATEKDPF